jgi:hypothetical protein
MVPTQAGLAHDMCQDAQYSNGIFILDESHAQLEDKNWPKLIVESEQYRKQYAQAVTTFLNEPPCQIPPKMDYSSVRERYADTRVGGKLG